MKRPATRLRQGWPTSLERNCAFANASYEACSGGHARFACSLIQASAPARSRTNRSPASSTFEPSRVMLNRPGARRRRDRSRGARGSGARGRRGRRWRGRGSCRLRHFRPLPGDATMAMAKNPAAAAAPKAPMLLATRYVLMCVTPVGAPLACTTRVHVRFPGLRHVDGGLGGGEGALRLATSAARSFRSCARTELGACPGLLRLASNWRFQNGGPRGR
jgi:hypothetical protein